MPVTLAVCGDVIRLFVRPPEWDCRDNGAKSEAGAAKRFLHFTAERFAEEHRTSMIENVLLQRGIMWAWEEHGDETE